MKPERLVFWDIDGTLMYCGADGTLALNQTFRNLYGIDAAFEKVSVGHAMDAAHVRGVLERFSLPAGDAPKVKAAYASTLKEILQKDETRKILPGVQKLLSEVEKSGNTISALLTSNYQIGAELKLASVGLDSFFAFGGFGDGDGEKWDAAERCISEMEAALDTVFPKTQIFLVGDGVYDIETAKRLGIRSVAVGTGWTPSERLKEQHPDFYFDDLSGTAAVLRVLLGEK